MERKNFYFNKFMPIRLKPTRRRLLFGWCSVHLAYCFPSVSKNWIPDSLSAELGFRVTIVNGIPDSLSCIPDSTVNKHISYIEKLSLRAPSLFGAFKKGLERETSAFGSFILVK